MVQNCVKIFLKRRYMLLTHFSPTMWSYMTYIIISWKRFDPFKHLNSFWCISDVLIDVLQQTQSTQHVFSLLLLLDTSMWVLDKQMVKIWFNCQLQVYILAYFRVSACIISCKSNQKAETFVVSSGYSMRAIRAVRHTAEGTLPRVSGYNAYSRHVLSHIRIYQVHLTTSWLLCLICH